MRRTILLAVLLTGCHGANSKPGDVTATDDQERWMRQQPVGDNQFYAGSDADNDYHAVRRDDGQINIWATPVDAKRADKFPYTRDPDLWVRESK